jgi:hypothetical protein
MRDRSAVGVDSRKAARLLRCRGWLERTNDRPVRRPVAAARTERRFGLGGAGVEKRGGSCAEVSASARSSSLLRAVRSLPSPVDPSADRSKSAARGLDFGSGGRSENSREGVPEASSAAAGACDRRRRENRLSSRDRRGADSEEEEEGAAAGAAAEAGEAAGGGGARRVVDGFGRFARRAARIARDSAACCRRVRRSDDPDGGVTLTRGRSIRFLSS